MKAIVFLETNERLSSVASERLREQWREFSERGFSSPMVLQDGLTAKVIYVPDDFTQANCFTPDEAEFLIKQIKQSAVVLK